MDPFRFSKYNGLDWSSMFDFRPPNASIAQRPAPAMPMVFNNQDIPLTTTPMVAMHRQGRADEENLVEPPNDTGGPLRAHREGSVEAMNPPRSCAARRSKYSDLDWDKAKAKIRTLYLAENKSLQETMRIMNETYAFDASTKLYKEKFKVWKWQKNLPRDYAQFMVKKAEKRKREEDKETTFVYNGLRWTKERAAASASRTKKAGQNDEFMDVETPKSVQVETPKSSRGDSPNIPGPTIGGWKNPRSTSPASFVVEGESESDDDNTGEDESLLLSWKGHSRTTLIAMFDAAQSAGRRGDAVNAEKLLVQVLEGYENLLSPTHEDTNKVAYALATFYAEHDRMHDANKTLEEVSRKHIKRYGVQNRETQQQVLQVVELLNAWNRPADALAYLTRSKYLLDISNNQNGSSSRNKRNSRRRAKSPRWRGNTPLGLDQIAGEIIKDADPTTINCGLEIARVHAAAKDGAAVALLLAIIRHCQKDPKGLVFENLEARCELLKHFQSSGPISENAGHFREAWRAANASWVAYDWNAERFKSLNMMEVCMKLAGVFLKAGFHREAKEIFRKVEDKAATLYGCENERTIWILISIGILYQNIRGWRDAQEWFQQALAFSYTAFGGNDGITRSLEASLEKEHFSYVSDEGRPFKTIFGVGGLIIRPGRLHLE